MSTVQQALQVAAIGLPVMFGVILIFILVSKALIALFPAKDGDKK